MGRGRRGLGRTALSPVRAALYVALAVAAGIVWFARDREDVCGPLGYFGVLLAATLAWTRINRGLAPLRG